MRVWRATGPRPGKRAAVPSALCAALALACGGGQVTPATAADDPAAGKPESGQTGTGQIGAEQKDGETALSPDATGAESTAGASAPDFELDRLDGGSFRLSERLGKDVILLDFWATYCEPCLAAMPHLDELYRAHKAQGLLVVGISIDGPESSGEVQSTIQRLGVGFPILLDSESRVVAQYNPKVTAPYSVLIGRTGRVIGKQEGYTSAKADALQQKIEQALTAK